VFAETLGPLVTALVVLVTVYGYTMALLSARRARPDDEGDRAPLFFILLVPALNEELVIGNTLSSLLALSGDFLVLLIDDASDDDTVAVVTPFLEDPRVRLLARPRAEARTGKGAALNAGYATARRLAHDLGLLERYGAEHVIVTVFDSDGRVDPDFLQAVGPLFRDPKTAGVQTSVRMYNARQNLLTFWQHLEFVVWGEIFLRAKSWLGSATLGGNGQSVRLSALDDLGREPWHASLTEDLDLSLRLLARGWRLRFCPSVAVWQEAVPAWRRLVRQRSRWLQGHVVSWNYLPRLLRSGLPLHTRADLLLFLLLPAVFLPIGLASLASWAALFLGILLAAGDWHLRPGDALIAYLVGFVLAPLTLWGWRRAEHPRLALLLLHSHLFVFFAYVWLFAAAETGWNILRGRRAWAKTSRVNAQAAPVGQDVRPAALAPAALAGR
jgi:cellulose synthase/poly-beta-1,6-N-acetylglucosamine synthase-like glycosyltransferase